MAANRVGDQTLRFPNAPRIEAAWTVVGPEEGKGPKGSYFDTVMDSDMCGEPTPEKAERRLLETAIAGALSQARLRSEDMDVFVGGDLLNQIISATFNARALQIPYLGLYNACATFGEAMCVASVLVDGDYSDRVLLGVASHYQTAERQFRLPVEQNTQRKPYSQTTVSGAGAAVLSRVGTGPRIAMATVGRVVDRGEKDTNDMGCAMAPAAAETLMQHFRDTGRAPEDYDLILTGDLASCGSKVFRDLVKRGGGYALGAKYEDGGLLMFGPEAGALAGGSGCACSATIILGYVLSEMRKGRLLKVLVMPTGALHSTISAQQGETMPCIAHAIVLESGES